MPPVGFHVEVTGFILPRVAALVSTTGAYTFFGPVPVIYPLAPSSLTLSTDLNPLFPSKTSSRPLNFF